MAALSIVFALPTGLQLDNSDQILLKTHVFEAQNPRENSQQTATEPFFRVVEWLVALQTAPDDHLPTNDLKPRYRVHVAYAAPQNEAYPRVSKVLGPGTVKNEYGAVCVPYARSQGFNVSGNANQWPVNAKAAGYTVDRTPELGAILVTAESSGAGHVTGRITKIENGYNYVSEQNLIGQTLTEGWVPNSLIVAVIHPIKQTVNAPLPVPPVGGIETTLNQVIP